MRFAHPWFLLLLIVVPFLVLYELHGMRKSGAVRYSDVSFFNGLTRSAAVHYYFVPNVLRLLCVIILIGALARPQAGTSEILSTTEGVDIVLALDISGSMRAEDFKPQNRLGAAKEVIKEFVSRRQFDRVGLVVFARYAITQCPLTLDYGVLTDLITAAHIGMIEDGTAVGTAIATSVNRLKDSSAKSKVIILLTDGENNAGEIDPITAAEVAKTFDVKIYTIGAGSQGSALYPVDDPIFGKRYVRAPTRIDEKTLDQIARITGGYYFRAKDEKSLARIYEHIDELEKTEIEVTEYIDYEERCLPLLLIAFILFIAEIIISETWLRKIP